MKDRKHALLSASGSSRWMNCPPSARLEENLSEEISKYAKEGTFAHILSELYINYYLGNMKREQFNKEVKILENDKFYSQELMEYVQVYIDFAIEKINESRKKSVDAVIMVEMKLDYSEWVTDGFGTGDLVIITDNNIEILDLKFGRGVLVSAKENSQMRLYSLGVIQEFGFLYDINSVKMTIVQPRLNNISSDEMQVEDLLKWASEEVKPKAKLAINGEGKLKAGEHCRFCKARYTCSAKAEENKNVCKLEFQKIALPLGK